MAAMATASTTFTSRCAGGQLAAATSGLATGSQTRQQQQQGIVFWSRNLNEYPSTSIQAVQCGSSAGSEVFGNSSMAGLRQPSLKAVMTRGTASTGIVCKVSKGDVAPPLSLKDQNGKVVNLSKFRGKNVVLYFYPADDTPGCTKEACAFRDAYQDFRRAGAVVIGISSDSPESHANFAKKYDLPYVLLSDEGGMARKEWGVPGDLFGVLPGRQTYVIDKKGVVQLIFNNQFQPEKHVTEALKILSA